MGDKTYEPSKYEKYELERRDNDDMFAASYSKHTTANDKKERYFKSHKNKTKSVKKREIGKSLNAADWEVSISDNDATREEKKKHKSVTSDYIFSDFNDRPKIGGGRKRSTSSAHRKRSKSKIVGAGRKRSTSKSGDGRKRSTSKSGGGRKRSTSKIVGAGRKRSTSKSGSHRRSSTSKSGGGRRKSKTRK